MSTIKDLIRKILTQFSGSEIFNQIVQAIETESATTPKLWGQVTSSSIVFKRNPNKVKGDLWEDFCKEWLIASDKVEEVWKLPELPDDLRQQLRLRKQDLGIDLVARTKTGYWAIQAKFRSAPKYTRTGGAGRSGDPGGAGDTGNLGKVNWSQLSTFWGLVDRSGPIGGWQKRIVMTNCSGITWKIPKTDRDQTMAVGTFRATTRDVWHRMSGDNGYRLVERDNNVTSLEDLRNLRLKFMAVSVYNNPGTEE